APCWTRSEAAHSHASSSPTTRQVDRSSRSYAARMRAGSSSRSGRSCARSRARKACSARTCMASVDVPVALLGYGTVGAAVNRLLVEGADEIERATGHKLRVTLVVTNVHRVLGIVNGTTNFILTRMEEGADYEEALAEAQRLGYAEADPTDDVSGADAAAKMAVLATVAFGSRVELADVAYEGIEGIKPHHVAAARELETVVRLVGSATLVDGAVDGRVGPAVVDGHHPLAAVVGAFNAVMLQGDAIREITLEGPGAGGIETASAVVADMVSVLGTTGTGFLQNDACWRSLSKLPPGD